MNKYVRTAFCLPFGAMKMLFTKICHPTSFSGSLFSVISPFTEISLDKGGQLSIGKRFRLRDGAKIRVRKGAQCIIGDNVSINSNNMVACHDKIVIGEGCQLSPNVQIYDHDHDFRVSGGISEMKYTTSPVVIGKNVWIGANTVILRGTTIGDNCVIGAGCVLKGDFPADSVVVQKRETVCKGMNG